MYSKKKTTQKKQMKKTKQIRVGAWPTHPLPSFSRIFNFFLLLQNPLASTKIPVSGIDV